MNDASQANRQLSDYQTSIAEFRLDFGLLIWVVKGLLLIGMAAGLTGFDLFMFVRTDPSSVIMLGVSCYLGLISVLTIELGLGERAIRTGCFWILVVLMAGVIVFFGERFWSMYLPGMPTRVGPPSLGREFNTLLAALPWLSASCAFLPVLMNVWKGFRLTRKARGHVRYSVGQRFLKVGVYAAVISSSLLCLFTFGSDLDKNDTIPLLFLVSVIAVFFGALILIPTAWVTINAPRSFAIGVPSLLFTLAIMASLLEFVDVSFLRSSTNRFARYAALLSGPVGTVVYLGLTRAQGWRLIVDRRERRTRSQQDHPEVHALDEPD